MRRPQMIAGACGDGVWPDNSLEGARACTDAPVDGIEIDVHLTADGHVVAHHDERIAADQARLDGAWLDAPGPYLCDAALADLRAFDLGRSKPGSPAALKYPDRGLDDVRIATLPEILQALASASGPRRQLFVEIKSTPPHYRHGARPEALLDAVLADLDAAGWVEDSKIIAFDWSVLRLLHERRPDMATAHLTVPASFQARIQRLADGRSPWADGCDPIDWGGSDLRAIQAHGGREWSPHIADVTPERLAEARDLGLAVGVWGVSRAEEIDHLSRLGVDALTVSGPSWSGA